MPEPAGPRGETPEELQQLEQKSIIYITPVSEEYVMWQWALGEAQNPKWERRNSQISHALQEKIKTISPQNFDQQFSEEERRKILDAFFKDENRQAVENIRAMKCQWFIGVVQTDEIRDFYIVQWPLSEKLAPSGKLLEYTKAFKRGQLPQEAKTEEENIERMRRTFDISQMIGAPIVLSQTGKPPYCAVDGITRLSIAIMNSEEGKMQRTKFPIIVGVSERIFEWKAIPQQMKMV